MNPFKIIQLSFFHYSLCVFHTYPRSTNIIWTIRPTLTASSVRPNKTTTLFVRRLGLINTYRARLRHLGLYSPLGALGLQLYLCLSSVLEHTYLLKLNIFLYLGAGIAHNMSAHWKFILNSILDDPEKYSEIVVSLYCLILDYHDQRIDTICDEYQMKQLQKAVIQVDAAWALDEIPGLICCERCEQPFLDEDVKPFRHSGHTTSYYCEDCHNMTGRMEQQYTTDDESDEESEEDVEDKLSREIEWKTEMDMGK
jgi:hypothetical protein